MLQHPAGLRRPLAADQQVDVGQASRAGVGIDAPEQRAPLQDDRNDAALPEPLEDRAGRSGKNEVVVDGLSPPLLHPRGHLLHPAQVPDVADDDLSERPDLLDQFRPIFLPHQEATGDFRRQFRLQRERPVAVEALEPGQAELLQLPELRYRALQPRGGEKDEEEAVAMHLECHVVGGEGVVELEGAPVERTHGLEPALEIASITAAPEAPEPSRRADRESRVDVQRAVAPPHPLDGGPHQARRGQRL